MPVRSRHAGLDPASRRGAGGLAASFAGSLGRLHSIGFALGGGKCFRPWFREGDVSQMCQRSFPMGELAPSTPLVWHPHTWFWGSARLKVRVAGQNVTCVIASKSKKSFLGCHPQLPHKTHFQGNRRSQEAYRSCMPSTLRFSSNFRSIACPSMPLHKIIFRARSR